MRVLLLLSLALLCSMLRGQTCADLPFAKFSFEIAGNGFTVNFKSESCDPTLLYQWDFDDGTQSTYAQNEHDPVHTYGYPGTYIVKMTVKNPCGQTFTQEATIIIQAGSPSNLWVTLSGPTLAFECQDVSFSVQATGGVPPLKYEWKLGPYYCESGNCISCQGSSNYVVGNSSITAHFGETGLGCNSVWVKVTDAIGQCEEKNLCLKVKPGLTNIEIRHVAESASCGGDYPLEREKIGVGL